MLDAKIDIVGMGDLPLIVRLYNDIFHPAREEEFFRRRFAGRYNHLMMIASVENDPVGFFLGFELKPTVYFTWLYGVDGDLRRKGIGSQLMEAAHAWTRDHGYDAMRLECNNNHRAMLHLSLAHHYDIVGIRWDTDRAANLVILEAPLHDTTTHDHS
ncbi:MAG: GNAT family N-acetyltransferase [Phycisphaeraceae bacterium]